MEDDLNILRSNIHPKDMEKINRKIECLWVHLEKFGNHIRECPLSPVEIAVGPPHVVDGKVSVRTCAPECGWNTVQELLEEALKSIGGLSFMGRVEIKRDGSVVTHQDKIERFELGAKEFVEWSRKASTLALLNELDRLREGAEHGEADSMWRKGVVEGEILMRCGSVEREKEE